MVLRKREKIILFITICVAAISLAYVYIIEPRIQFISLSDETYLRYRSYASLLDRKDEINARYDEIFSPKYFKKTVEEQQVALQIYLEETIKSAGVKEILSIRSLQMKENASFRELSVQLDARLPHFAVAFFLYKLGAGRMPVRIERLQIYAEENDPKNVKMQIAVAMRWAPVTGGKK
ncbi:MAG: GspMb/PilO family protein [Elusimicrobiota bacterium]